MNKARKGLVIWLAACIILSFSIRADVLSAKAANIRIDKQNVRLEQGEVIWLYIIGTSKKASFKSSNPQVASVSRNGRVKAKKPGRTIITATIKGIEYKSKITVKKKVYRYAGSATKSVDAGEYSLNNVHKGVATYYNKSAGGMACLDYLEEAFYTVAMNKEDYLNGLAGAYIKITDEQGHSVKAFVTDMLPGGEKGDIDLTRKTFARLEPLETGRMNVSWKIIPTQTTRPISYEWNKNSTKYWWAVQIRNGRYPIKKVECYDRTTKKYVELERQDYNYFTMPSGVYLGGGPYKFRVTDFYGHVLVDRGIRMNKTGRPVDGKNNFPY